MPDRADAARARPSMPLADAWIDGILGSMGGDAPRSIFLMDSVEALEEEEVEGDEHHHETELDEHIWTSP